jgi:hypothetical protein
LPIGAYRRKTCPHQTGSEALFSLWRRTSRSHAYNKNSISGRYPYRCYTNRLQCVRSNPLLLRCTILRIVCSPKEPTHQSRKLPSWSTIRRRLPCYSSAVSRVGYAPSQFSRQAKVKMTPPSGVHRGKSSPKPTAAFSGCLDVVGHRMRLPRSNLFSRSSVAVTLLKMENSSNC